MSVTTLPDPDACAQFVHFRTNLILFEDRRIRGYAMPPLSIVALNKTGRYMEHTSKSMKTSHPVDQSAPILGIEISGRGQRVAVSDRNGRILGQAHAIDSSAPAPMVLETVERLIDQACQNAGVSTDTVAVAGIAFGGPVDADRGLTLLSHRASGFENFPLVHLIEELYDIPTVMENDARAAALGESMFGAARGSRDLVYIHLGTGVGAGIIIDGQFARGPSGTAGEIGHMVVSPDGPICSCGKPGHLEAYASGPSILSRYRIAIEQTGCTTTIESSEEERTLTVRTIFTDAARSDGPARQVVTETSQVLGIAVANLITILNPGVVVFGGYVSQSGPVLIDSVSSRVRQYAYPAAARRVRINRSHLGADANVIGAVALALRSQQ